MESGSAFFVLAVKLFALVPFEKHVQRSRTA
jgi:hypothetical protein